MKRGLFRFFTFLLVGIAVGLYLRLEEYAGHYLMGLLAQEIKDGTGGCDLRYKKISLSLISLNAEANDLSVVCGDKPAMNFEQVLLNASWRSIFSKTIEFDDLQLRRGKAFGVSPKSATYKFIDYLTSPLPPGSNPPAIKILLHQLSVEESSFEEELGRNLLVADGFRMLLTYDENRDALLKPFIKKLDYVIRRPQQQSFLPLGEAKGNIKITDDETQITNFILNRDGSQIAASGTETIGKPGSLKGKASLAMTLQYIGLPEWLVGSIVGEADITGSLGDPDLKGSFVAPNGKPFGLNPGDFSVIEVEGITGNFAIDVNDGDPIVDVATLEGASNGQTIKIVEPLQIKDGNLSGKLTLTTEKLVVGPVEFRNLSSDVSLSGPLDKVTANLNGDIKEVESLNAIIRDVSFTAHNQDQFFLVDAHQKNVPEGTLTLKAKVDLSSPAPIITESAYEFTNYPFTLLFSPAPSNDSLNFLRLSGAGKATGPFDAGLIDVESKFKATSWFIGAPDLLLNELSIKNGQFELNAVTEKSKTSVAKVSLGLTEKTGGALSFSLHPKAGYTLLPAACLSTDSMLEVKFQRGAFTEANGSLRLNSLNVGCKDSFLALRQPTTISINKGSFNFNSIDFLTLDNKLTLKGNFAPLGASNVSVTGVFPLASLDELLPSIDDIAGTINTNISFNGTLADPNIKGDANLRDGRIGLESSDITLAAVNGAAQFDGSVVRLANFGGELNGGTFTVTGEYVLSDPGASKLTFNAQNMAFAPSNGLTVAADAVLNLTHINEKTGIQGLVSVTSAEFEKRLDVTTLARGALDFIFASRKPVQLVAGQSDSTLDIPLDIKVSANRNIIAVTNFFGIESRGSFNIAGTLQAPTITGSIEALNGWFGLSEHRFNLTSGVVQFHGANSLPTLSVFGESLVRSNAGDILTVYLEASGTIDSPTIHLSSDTGLSQSEILSLLTSSGQIMQQTLVNQVGSNSLSNPFSLIDAVPLLNYSQFLRYLGQIDSISIEPQFNIQTGLIEPTISATKRLSKSVYLLGQGFIGSQITETRLGAVYNILPYLNLQAFFTSASDQANVALEVNSAVTLLAQRKKFASLQVEGNAVISSDEILSAANLNTTSRITPEEMINVRQAIKKLYRRAGYFDARVLSTCRADGEYCNKIELRIEEALPSKITSIKLEDPRESNQAPIPDELIPFQDVAELADAETLTNARAEILTWLRDRGFLGARVDATYDKTGVDKDDLSRDLVFKIHRGRPIIFRFSGNKTFNADSLLSTINIKSRKVPFGANTGRILAQSIDQLYREAGFLDVVIEQERISQVDSEHDIIVIKIDEGIHYSPAGVKFLGLVSITEEKIQRKIKRLGKQAYFNIFSPETLLLETLDLNAKEIRKILVQEGFNDALVEVGFEKHPEDKNAFVVYSITEGERSPAIELEKITIEDGSTPEGLQLPDMPKGTIFQIGLTEFTDQLIKSLADQGYRNASLKLVRSTPEQFGIQIYLGDPTQAGAIRFSGLQDISESYLRSIIDLAPGEPLSQQKLRLLRHKLLSQGMFSKIDIAETDSLDPSIKNIEIKVQEKPLTTLDLGGGYNTEFGAHIFAEGVDRSLFKDGRSLSLRLDAYVNSPSGESISRGIAALKYTVPSLFDSKYVLTEDLRLQKFNASVYEFDLDRTSLTSSIYRSWQSGLSASFGHTALFEDVSQVSPDVVLSPFDSGTNILSYIGATLSFDRRDNPLNPSSGYNLIWDAKYATESIGSDANYAGTGLRTSNIIPFEIGFNRFAFAQSLRGGVMEPLNGDSFVPISQRYYLGGRTTVRGYGENKLGPRGAEGGILGGESMLSGSVELQYRLLDSFSFNTFFDAGNVYLNSFDQEKAEIPDEIIKEDDDFLRYSTGIGVRFLSPIGPVGLDLGFPINRRDDDDPWRIHFNIGSNF